jgi:hypothetical protein
MKTDDTLSSQIGNFFSESEKNSTLSATNLQNALIRARGISVVPGEQVFK